MKTWEASCDCGWTIRVPYRGTATYRLSKHSCTNYLRRITVDKTPKPCLHKHAGHQHGSHACYVVDRCRCPPCTTANTAYENHRNKQHAYGRWNGYIDAQPARDHTRKLMAAGLGPKRLAKVAGVPHGVLSKLLYGNHATGAPPSKRIRPATAEKILAVTPTLENLGKRVAVDPAGTRRRLQALIAFGWSQSKLARRLDWSPANFGAMLHGRSGIGAHTALTVRDLYDELSMTPPPQAAHHDRTAASRARNYAKTRGWVPPLAWDDDALDDPDAAPAADAEPVADVIDVAAVWRFLDGDHHVRLTHAERVEIARHLQREGWSTNRIVTALHISWATWTRIRQEAEALTGEQIAA